MNIVISAKNIELTDNLKSAVEDKLGKLDKYFVPDTVVNVTMGVERGRHKIEVTIPVKGSIIRTEQESNDMYVTLDLIEEIIERQLRKYKTKIIDKHQGGGNFRQDYIENDFYEDEDIKIIRTKKFEVMPMYPEDACVQMELLGHNFFAFVNAETGQVNVAYKRKDGNYGLLEPEA
ncbi:MAG: ribosome-associated translation inhibitor RaiA [Lachnospiraceae bacterium]|nr:ribosome-associated translation inhibitor RaiA [Lachnospiraceae bacterium]